MYIYASTFYNFFSFLCIIIHTCFSLYLFIPATLFVLYGIILTMINLDIKILIAVLAAVVFGNGCVVLFNHIPQKWFEDWAPDEAAGDKEATHRILPAKLLEADNSGRQRLTSTPWKYIFTALFGICGVYLSITSSISYEISVLVVMAILLEIAVSDQLYSIVPDQLQVLLAISAVGFVSYNENWWEPLAGAGIGLAIGLSVWGLGQLIFRTGSLGGADIKFFLCMGLVVGRSGVIIVFVLTTLIFAVYSAIRLATKKSSITDSNPMLPSAAVATTAYLVFLYNISGILF